MTKPRGTAPTMTAKQTLEWGAALLRQLPDLDPVVAQQWIEKQGALNEFLRGLVNGPQNSWPIYSIAVDYGLTVEQMVVAGKYDWANSDINKKNFPPSRKSGRNEMAIRLVQFDRAMTSQEVEAELDALGLRPATVSELLSLGAQHPELQRENPIVGLGSRWRHSDGDEVVPVLDGLEGGRELSLSWFGGRWGRSCRFAAVAK